MLVGWFFASMRTAWGNARYNSQFADEDDVKFAMRYWGPRILDFDRVQLARFLELANKEREKGNKEFTFPDIPKILGLAEIDRQHPSHKLYKPETLLEDKGAKERAKTAGAEALQNMRKTMGIDDEKETN